MTASCARSSSEPARGRATGTQYSQPGNSSPGTAMRAGMLCELVKKLARLRILEQRQQRCFFDLQNGPLRFGIESPHGLDQIAEELDANGLRRLGRKDIENAAAHRILADHLHRIAFLVTDASQVRDDIFEESSSSPTRSVSAS